MSWFASIAPTSGPNLHPVHLLHDQEALFGPLEDDDTAWLATSSGFVTETHVYYGTLPSGAFFIWQIIHSSVGIWYPSIHITFRYVDPAKNIHIWKSTTVTNFVVAPSDKLDRRSVKGDQFSITLDPATPTKYTLTAKYDDEVQVSLVFERLTQGFKVGAGPRGGMTFFGALADPPASPATPDTTSGGDGYVVHRLWPRCAVSGVLRLGADIVDVADSRGFMVHAIQGMRPNVLAARWELCNFQSPAAGGDGVALTLMGFTTPPAYGGIRVNFGSVVVGDKLVAVTAGGTGLDGTCEAEHLDEIVDPETGYAAPGLIAYRWSAPTLFPDGECGLKASTEAPRTQAKLDLDLVTSEPGEPYQTRGLIIKVDVLGEIPYIVKKFVNYAAGTKPFIYTWLNPATASITLPADLSSPTGTETKTIEVAGHSFNEAVFIS